MGTSDIMMILMIILIQEKIFRLLETDKKRQEKSERKRHSFSLNRSCLCGKRVRMMFVLSFVFVPYSTFINVFFCIRYSTATASTLSRDTSESSE